MPENKPSPAILVVDDEPEFCRFIEDCLAAEGYQIDSVNDGGSALEALRKRSFDVVLCDFRMKGIDGISVISGAHELDPDLPIILITAFGSIDHAVEALRAGAYNYLTKPVSVTELRLHVSRALEARRLRSEVERLRGVAEDLSSLEGIVARSKGMSQVVATVRQLERSTSNVMVSGESGTGKELIARALHLHSPVREGPFIPVNCASIPEALLESELFGHTRGAFTDARGDKPGLFHAARNGTLFLDEIGEMPRSLQSKMLRVLEDRVVRPVGSTEGEEVDVRVISATNRDLEAELGRGFRADLYYRLHVVEIVIPPLRERREDIPAIIDVFLQRKANGGAPMRLTHAALELLSAYPWPGNIRQLQNALEHATALARGSVLDIDDFPDSIRRSRLPGQQQADVPGGLGPRRTLREVEDLYIDTVLDHTVGNRTAAAAILGIDRKTLYKRLRNRGG